MTCGIYEIVNTVNGKRYVGSSVDIEKRWRAHKSLLNNGNHHSRHMQRSWNKSGPEAFIFSVIQECSESELLKIEQIHIDDKAEYNMVKFAGRNTGMIHTEEAREKMSLAQEYIWTEDKRKEVSARSFEMWSDQGFKDTAIENRNTDEYKSRHSSIIKDKWRDDSYREKTLKGLKSDERRRKLSVKLRSYEKYHFTHPIHGDRICSQWDLRNEFEDLSASCVSQICSGKQVKHKGWKVKSAP